MSDEPHTMRLRNGFTVAPDGAEIPTYGEYVLRADFDAKCAELYRVSDSAANIAQDNLALHAEVRRLRRGIAICRKYHCVISQHDPEEMKRGVCPECDVFARAALAGGGDASGRDLPARNELERESGRRKGE